MEPCIMLFALGNTLISVKIVFDDDKILVQFVLDPNNSFPIV